MCRWIAYAGPAIYMGDLLLTPENSLIRQSRYAQLGLHSVNADGFGVGWYGDRDEPGVFKDILPAWNDQNLRNIARQVSSPLFFGHVRAATGTAISRANCHPFRQGKWLFMHNGAIGGFETVRRDLALAVRPDLFPEILGTTDSELFFYLLLTHGLEQDPDAALVKTIEVIEDAQQDHGVGEPFTMTVAMSDGASIWAYRHASTGEAPSLYYGIGAKPQNALGLRMDTETAVIILSEPLDDDMSQWVAVQPDELIIAGDGGISAQAQR